MAAAPPPEGGDGDVAPSHDAPGPRTTRPQSRRAAPGDLDETARRTRHRLAVGAAGVGTFDWDLATGALDWDDALLRVFGLTRAQFGGTIEAFDALVHPADRGRVRRALADAITVCGEYAAEYRVLRPDGTTRWVQARGQALAGPAGTAERVIGAAYDTTRERAAHARIDRVLETMASAFYLLDHEWRFTYVNAEAERLLGRPRDELLGGVVWELFPAANASAFDEHYRAAVATGEPHEFEAHYPAPLDGWYEVRAWPGPDGLSVYFHDVTARHRAQEAARAAEARGRLLRAVSDDLASVLDVEDAVARLARHLVPTFGSACLVTLVDDHHRLRDIASWHGDPDRRSTVERYAATRLRGMSPTSYLHEALRSGTTVVVPDATERLAAVVSADAGRLLRELGPRTACIAPLRARHATVGAVTLLLGPDDADLSEEDLATLEQLADRAGLALDNARMYGAQRAIAEQLQRALLASPADPLVAARYLPAARLAQVGGDWHDAFTTPAGERLLVIGDVMGHDTQAAAAMGQVRTLLRGIAHTTGAGPAEVLERLDAAMQDLQVGAVATALVLAVGAAGPGAHAGPAGAAPVGTGAGHPVRWASAGHLPALVVGPDGRARQLRATHGGIVLGLGSRTARQDSHDVLADGSTLVLYTDGLVERRGTHLRDGIAGLTRVAERTAAAVAPDDLEGFADAVLAGMAVDEPEDDVALVVTRLARRATSDPPAHARRGSSAAILSGRPR